MKDKDKYNISQLFNFAPDSYLERTSRPLYGIVFLLPFIIFYEFGVIFTRTDVLNNSGVLVDAFVWLQKALGYLGFGSKFAWIAPPLAVLAILFALQLASGKKWRFYLSDLLPMAIECTLLAIPLIVFSLFLNSPAAQGDFNFTPDQAETLSIHASQHIDTLASTAEVVIVDQQRSLIAEIITGIGAGIYEELVFRLILITVLMIIFQDIFRIEHKGSIILSVLISAALFSMSHHVDFLTGELNQQDPFSLTKFCFRAAAGIYFAALFAIRGFGITAGTHAFYDILAVLINAFFFNP